MDEQQKQAIIQYIAEGNLEALYEYKAILSGDTVIVENEWDIIKLYQTIKEDGSPYQPRILDKSGLNLLERYPRIKQYVSNWIWFAEDILGVSLDSDQQAILKSVQDNNLTSV